MAKGGGRAVFQAVLRAPGVAPVVVGLDRFPCVLGRGREATIPLAYPGVWERHVILDLSSDEGLVARVSEGALASVDGHPITRCALRNGAEITLGSVTAQVSLAPVRRRSLVQWEIAVWLIMAAVAVAEVAWAWWMLGR